MIKNLEQLIVAKLYHYENGKKVCGNCTDLRGNCTNLRGDCSGIWGNCTGLRGNCSNISGDLDLCKISEKERKIRIDIKNLIKEE